MPDLATALRVGEMRDEDVDGVRVESERRETLACLGFVHRVENALSLNRSTRQLRSAAIARSFRSGFTATGWPTASRNGTSLAESEYAVDSARSMPSSAGERRERVCLRPAVEAPGEPARVAAVDDLGRRSETAVEAELGDERVDDLLERRRDDERLLAALSVSRDEVERVAVDVRLEGGVHGLGDDLAHHRDRKSLQERHRALGRLPDTGRARPVADEDELREHRLRPVPAPEEPSPMEGGCERQRAGARDQRPVEVEERGARHASDGRCHEIAVSGA